jgi:hypothetical protein
VGKSENPRAGDPTPSNGRREMSRSAVDDEAEFTTRSGTALPTEVKDQVFRVANRRWTRWNPAGSGRFVFYYGPDNPVDIGDAREALDSGPYRLDVKVSFDGTYLTVDTWRRSRRLERAVLMCLFAAILFVLGGLVSHRP